MQGTKYRRNYIKYEPQTPLHSFAHVARPASLYPLPFPCIRLPRLSGEAHWPLHAPPACRFVSNNSGVEHRDARCTLPHERCSFALVRAFVGYQVHHTP